MYRYKEFQRDCLEKDTNIYFVAYKMRPARCNHHRNEETKHTECTVSKYTVNVYLFHLQRLILSALIGRNEGLLNCCVTTKDILYSLQCNKRKC